MAQGERISFELEVGSFAQGDLVVWELRGREALGEPFLFDVVTSARSEEPVALEGLLGEVAKLHVCRPDGTERVVHGWVDGCRLAGLVSGAPRYGLRIVPRLARLARVARSRIFQDLAVPDLVATVLDEHGVPHRASLSGRYELRPYVVQHQETDLAFVSRLLEEEGIGFFIEHGTGAHTLVLFDHNGAGPELSAPLPVRSAEQGGESVYADGISAAARLDASAVMLRDFDPDRPLLDLSARAGDGGLERYEYPDGYVAPAEGTRRAGVRLAQAQARAATWGGLSTESALLPGTRFALDGVAPGLLCVSVVHHGKQACLPSGEVVASYWNDFDAVAGEAPWRPPRCAPRPRAPRLETAVVTGPQGEEIHVDRLGRVKVQFHWDREGRGDDRSSCWVRVAQRWAGAGMGTNFVPRVGQEVLVRFVGPDADRPLVVGAVFDGVNPPPLSLPAQKTRSTQRTSSSRGGDGANELCFEDAAGEEGIYLHAQRNYTGEVRNDRTSTVRRAEAVDVGANLTHTIVGPRTTAVACDAQTQVEGGQTLAVALARTDAVGGDAEIRVGQARTITVGAARQVAIARASTETIGAASALTVGGAYAITVGLASNLAVGAARLEQIVGLKKEVVNQAREEQVQHDRSLRVLGEEEIDITQQSKIRVGQDARDEVGKAFVVEVAGPSVQLARSFRLKADRFTIQVGGRRMLVARKSGDVNLQIASLTVDASSSIRFQGRKVKKIASGSSSGAARTQEPADAKGTVNLRFAGMSSQEAGRRPDQYVLEATDGSYRQQKAVKADAGAHDTGVQLQFAGAPVDRKYRLKHVVPGGHELVLADGVSFFDLAGHLSGLG